MKTRYIDVAAIEEMIVSRGLDRILPELADYIRHDYLRWSDFEKSARLASHSANGVIELMPITDGRLYSFKYVNGHPRNTADRLLSVMGFGVLADVATGYLLLLSEFTLTTALRTAATSALAAQVMARRDAHRMALVGNGAQGEFQALAFYHLLGIREIRAYDVDARATRKLIANLAALPDLTVVAADSVAQAVRGADIVTTVTADKRKAQVLLPEMIEPGMHLNAVGGDCPGKTELHVDILKDARIVVEFEPQTRIEGEIQQLAPDRSVLHLWEVLQGRQAGRATDSEVTLFDSVGFALEDFSALRYIYDLSRDYQTAGSWLDLIPEPVDPKNLYALLQPSGRDLVIT